VTWLQVGAVTRVVSYAGSYRLSDGGLDDPQCSAGVIFLGGWTLVRRTGQWVLVSGVEVVPRGVETCEGVADV
jgi:hypothetical protein